jgi:cell division protein FtsL
MAARNVRNSKKKRIKRNPKMIVACLLLMVVFIAELFFFVWCRDQSRQIDSNIINQTHKVERLLALQDNLKIELARLKSPRRIAQIAREKLGLITPTPAQTIVIP